jgi:hypothetical protein
MEELMTEAVPKRIDPTRVFVPGQTATAKGYLDWGVDRGWSDEDLKTDDPLAVAIAAIRRAGRAIARSSAAWKGDIAAVACNLWHASDVHKVIKTLYEWLEYTKHSERVSDPDLSEIVRWFVYAREVAGGDEVAAGSRHPRRRTKSPGAKVGSLGCWHTGGLRSGCGASAPKPYWIRVTPLEP